MPNDFTVPAFLRAIGKGPDEKPEWWRDGFAFIDGPSNDCDFYLACPFADILTAWTPEKDALLLGAGLDHIREKADGVFDNPCVHRILWGLHPESKLSWAGMALWLLTVCDRPGLTLARAIWAAMKGGGQ